MTRRLALALAIAALVAPAAARPGGVVRIDHRDPSELPVRGPTTAPVTIELFFTPGPWRNQVVDYLEQLQARHPSKIRLVYRVLGVNGTARLPYAVLEAYAEGKFFELIKALAHSGAIPTDVKLLEIGRQVGLDPVRLEAAIHHPPAAYERLIAENERRRNLRTRRGALPSALFNGHVPQKQLAGSSLDDLEGEFRAAKDRAEELLDRGADPNRLAEAFDDESRDPLQDIVIKGEPADDDEQAPPEPPLALPPIRTRGLPSFGAPDAAVSLVVLCNPTTANCQSSLRIATNIADNNPETVRVVWAPYYDVAREEAADLGLLGDAAMCAERVGTSSDLDFDRPASAGWRWVEAVFSSRDTRRHQNTEELIDAIATRLRVDHRAFAACRARLAGSTVSFIEAAHRSGVHSSPATLVGGRIYGPIHDADTLQKLVEAELSPGGCDVDHGCIHLGDYAPVWRRGL